MESKPSIKILPEHLIDQIKAGEVIEGAASLIKELVENSVDANSTQIKIHVENNGLDLISIEDNGLGMSMEELPLAFCRHATSKITRFEDLYSLGTFGFRGEALASIASISRVTTFSKPVEGLGGKLVYHGGKLISHLVMENLEQGTSIFVRDLFYNTPVRFKFVKSKISEKNAILKIINSFIISNPSIYFSVKWDDKDKTIFQPTSWPDRVLKVLPKGDYREIKGEYDGYEVKGFLSPESSKGNQKNHQYLFANNRLFSDKSLHSAITTAMTGIWGLGESGNYCIFISANPGNVDVNVHPRKTEVRFLQPSLIFSLIQSSIKNSVYDLKNNSKNNPIGLKSYLENNLQELPDIKDDLLNPIFKITDDFILYPVKNKYLLIHFPSLLISFIKIHFKPVEEGSQIPLLIGEPYELANENLRVLLKTYGLNFQKLDDVKMILLTIPPYLSELPFRKIVGSLIKFFSNVSNNINLISKKDLNLDTLSFSFSQIKTLIKPFEKNLPDESFVKVFDNELLNSIYYPT